MAARHDIELDKGSTYAVTLRIKMPGGSTPMDLTGHVARMQARRSYASPTPELDLTSEPGGGLTVHEAEGEIDIIIGAAVSAAVKAQSLVYDLETEDAGGVVTRWIEGVITLHPEVTR